VNLEVDAATLEHAASAACRAALRAGLTEVDARDLAQDALVRALTSARPPDGVPLPAWVYGIAKNLGRDHAKSAKRREVAVEVTPEAVANEDLATVVAVRRAVEDLPLPLRDVITLHELEENSLRETAEALQIPFDTAKDRLRRAREQLRATLGDDSVLANERTHTRRRAAAYAGAIVAGLYSLLGRSPTAEAAAGAAIARTGATTGATTGSVAAITTARTIPLWLAAVGGTVLLAGGFAIGRISTPAREPAPTPVASTALVDEPVEVEAAVVQPQPAEPVVAAPVAPAASAPARSPRASAATPPPVAASAAAASPTAEPGNPEQLLVDRARAGLRRGMHDEALVTLMEHARRFPTGDLAEERDVLTIEAYLRAGKPELARRRIERYRVDHPDGVLRARVDALASELQP
jgi:RNA polymerase sigma factor (sigma-70 family)